MPSLSELLKEPIKEQAVLMGPRRSLVSVIAHPSPTRARSGAPTVVILNSGIVHRVGANRMTVSLARALAATGHTVVRLDLSGIGDSEARQDGLGPLEGGLADIREVVDSLEASGRGPQIILGGLCSGADFSVLYGSSDPRVVGTILLEPWVPRTLRHRMLHLASRATHIESWTNLARGKNPAWLAFKKHLLSKVNIPGDAADDLATRPEAGERRAVLEKAYARVMDGGCQCLAVLAGEHRYYREQFLDGYSGVRFGDRLRLEFFKTADHMFTGQAESARLIDVILDWVQRTTFVRASA